MTLLHNSILVLVVIFISLESVCVYVLYKCHYAKEESD